MLLTSFITAVCLAQTKGPAVPKNVPFITPVKTVDGLRRLAFAAADSGSKVVMTLADNSVRIMDSSTLGTIKTLNGHPQPCYGVAWSKDGAFIATGDESARIWIWNAITGEKVKEFRSHERGIQKLSFNIGHTLMVSTGKED